MKRRICTQAAMIQSLKRELQVLLLAYLDILRHTSYISIRLLVETKRIDVQRFNKQDDIYLRCFDNIHNLGLSAYLFKN